MSQRENKLLKEITHFLDVMPGNRQLDDHQHNTIINDTYIKLLDKEKQGKIFLDDFEVYKHYMFISVKNAINHLFAYQKTLKGKGERLFKDDVSWINNTSCLSEEIDYQRIREYINKLPPKIRAMWRFNTKYNWSQIYLGYAMNKAESTIWWQLKKIKEGIYAELNK